MAEKGNTIKCRDCGSVVQLRYVKGKWVNIDPEQFKFHVCKDGHDKGIDVFGFEYMGRFLLHESNESGSFKANRIHICQSSNR